MSKLLLVLFFLSSSLFAEQSPIEFFTYGGILKYNNSKKLRGDVKGIYIMGFDSPLKAELGAEHTRIVRDGAKTIKQSDYTLLLNFFRGSHNGYKIGVHPIATNDDLTKNGIVYIVGANYYQIGKYELKGNIYYSHYSNLKTSPRVLQVSPEFGFAYGSFYAKKPAFYVSIKADYIHPTKNREENDLKEKYFSMSFKVINHSGKFTTVFDKWYGRRAMVVENDGFTVVNATDEETGGFLISESYQYKKNQNFKISYSYLTFKEKDEDRVSNRNTFLIGYLYDF